MGLGTKKNCITLRIFKFCVLFLVLSIATLSAQDINTQSKTINATRTTVKPKIDGIIDEVFQQQATNVIEDFVTYEPIPGEPSSYTSKVYMLYDDQSVYIAAHLKDNPDDIIRDLSPRDDFVNTDFFGVIFDPYRTGLTGYSFNVSAAGVQSDIKLSIDGEDSSWNAVWKSAVTIQDDGWNVELEIPYSALRFPKEAVSDWSINFTRSVRKSRESSFWNPVNPEVQGLLNQMGSFKNIQDIKPPLRLSLSPYISTSLHTWPETPDKNAFSPKISGGMDLKYGINEAFTLDMVLIPDFSQVQSDLKYLNLTPFEQKFEENRPFFTEGTELFNMAGIFYSRRIGGNSFYSDRFDGLDHAQILKSPKNRLFNSTKISGRTNGNLGVGIFNAIETTTMGRYRDYDGKLVDFVLNPLTNYNVIVLEQALKNNSKIGLINTNVMRKGSATDANVTALAWDLKNKGQRYNFTGDFAFSNRFMEKNEQQQGFKTSLNLGRINSKLNYSVGALIESADYNPNDLGFLFSPNEKNFNASIGYFNYKPKHKLLAKTRFENFIEYQSLYAPDVFTSLVTKHELIYKLKSFNAFGLIVSTAPLGKRDYFEPRTSDFSKYLFVEPNVNIGGFVSTDYRKPLALDIFPHYIIYNVEGKYDYRLKLEPRIRVNSKILFRPSFEFSRQQLNQGFVNPILLFLPPKELVTIGTRNINTYANGFLTQINLSSKMSVQIRANHIYTSVKYVNFQRLKANGILEQSNYTGKDTDGKSYHNQNYNFFTLNAVFSWRFAPGSDLLVSYKSDLGKNTEYLGYIKNLQSIQDFYRYSGINVKALYYFDINRF